MIDTGSGNTILQHSKPVKCRLTMQTGSVVVVSGFNRKLRACSSFVQGLIRMMQAVANVRIMVGMDEEIPHGLILGRDFLLKLNIVVLQIKANIILRQLNGMNIGTAKIQGGGVKVEMFASLRSLIANDRINV